MRDSINTLLNMKLKQIPEDFVVKEVSKITASDDGDYYIYVLSKREANTIDACSQIAHELHLPLKAVGYAGNKDRNAVTEQYISIRSSKGPRDSKNYSLRFVCRSNQPISLGELGWNHFIITVRDIGKAPKKIDKFPNLFDEQRFSTNNVEIGRMLVKRHYKEALALADSPDANEHLSKHSTDCIGALRRIPLKLLRLYLHAYQSYLWNITAKKISTQGKLQIIGFGTEIKDDAEGKLLAAIMKEESITLRDFIFRDIPELSSEGNSRGLYCRISDLKISKLEDDELNEGRKKCVVEFSLPKGSYATMAIKSMFWVD